MQGNGKKRGRPHKDDARNITFSVKVNRKELDRLIYLMEEYDLTVSEVFRICLNEHYERVI